MVTVVTAVTGISPAHAGAGQAHAGKVGVMAQERLGGRAAYVVGCMAWVGLVFTVGGASIFWGGGGWLMAIGIWCSVYALAAMITNDPAEASRGRD